MGVTLSVDPGVLVYGDDSIPKNGATAVPQRRGLGLEPGTDVIAPTAWPEQTRPERNLRS
jgi:hypothetical protein